ncbi:MAG: nicotinamide-nucleotide amidase [Candidatus Marinamargulisbacteria bacterium]|jgi:nicotinamide-nucleotide amidase
MNIELIMTGEELLKGQTLNSNECDISGAFFRAGFRVSRSVTIGDDPSLIRSCLEEASLRSDVIVMTGGIGPTEDDRTRDVVADLLGVTLERDDFYFERMIQFLKNTGRKLTPGYSRQTEIPKGARPLSNSRGSALGFQIDIGKATLFVLPGVPSEMRHMFDDFVLPDVVKRVGDKFRPPLSRLFKTFGIGEAGMTDLLAPVYPLSAGVEISFRVKVPDVDLQLILDPNLQFDASAKFEELSGKIEQALSTYIYGYENESLAGNFSAWIKAKKYRLAIAESCTGGSVASTLIRLDGASKFLNLAIVPYQDEMKISLLNISASDLERFGAVSESVAVQMASRVREMGSADIGLSTTGVAGPEGGTDEKPVGTVFIAVAHSGGVEVKGLSLIGDRQMIQEKTVFELLRFTREILG